VGAAIALPWFEAMAADPKAAGKPPVRMGFFFIPSGVNVPDWMPKPGAGLPFILEPLKPVADSVLILTGLRQDKSRANGDGAGDHARETGTFLTGVQCRKTSGTDIQTGISVDQVAAGHVGAATALPSLELGIERGGASGDCDSGYSCAYTSNISWRSPTTPMAKETKPKAVFDRMFRGTAPGSAGIDGLRRSVLDAVTEDAGKLKAGLGGNDARKLEEYLDSVRALEKRVAGTAQAAASERLASAPKLDIPDKTVDYEQHVKLMFELIAIAYQTDSTRITTFMFGNGGSNRAYQNLGVMGGHHELSHHGKDPAKLASIRKINRFHMELFAGLLEKLKAVKEGSGTLLDNVMLCYGSGIGDGDRHNHDDLPYLLAGKGAGSIRSGRTLAVGKNTPACDLYLSMLMRMGVNVPAFGDSKMPLDLL